MRLLRALLLPPLVIALVVGVVLIGRNGWQATQAVRDVRAAGTAAVALEGALGEGDIDAVAQQLRAVEAFSGAAAERLQGPEWRLTEQLPGIGDDVAAVRRSSELAARAAGELGPPLLEVARELTPDRLRPVDGSLDLQALAASGEELAEAAAELQRIAVELDLIDLDEVVPQISSSVALLRFTLADASALVSDIQAATETLPRALGADGARRYLVLLLDPAVARPGGGEPVAYAVVEADDGELSVIDSGPLTEATTPAGVQPVGVRLGRGDRALAGARRVDTLGDAFRTPDFRRTGELVRTLWQQTGPGLGAGAVDGVVAVDSIALGEVAALLGATVPAPAETGDLEAPGSTGADDPDAPADPAPADSPAQRLALAEALRDVLTDVIAGDGDSGTLIDQLAAQGVETRLHLWTSDEQVERRLPRAGLAGAPTGDRDGIPHVGIYLGAPDDGPATELRLQSVRVRPVSCGPDGQRLVVSAVVAGPEPADGLDGMLGTAQRSDGALLLLGSTGGRLSTQIEVDGTVAEKQSAVVAGRRAVRVPLRVEAGERVVVRTTARTRPSHDAEPRIEWARTFPPTQVRVDPTLCQQVLDPRPAPP